jgi:hypothetical protein
MLMFLHLTKLIEFNSFFTLVLFSVPGLFMNGLSTLAACSVILFMKGDYKRVKAEKQLNAERVLNSAQSLPSIAEVQSDIQDRL